VTACDVSVVIPTRSRWRLLSSAALPAALAQEAVDHEVIVVDDGSTDETPERLAAYRDPRVRVVRHETSLGVAHARNAGLAVARGRWVGFLDDDDIWAPNKLRAQLDAAADADVVFAYTGGAGLDARLRYLFAVPPPDPATVTRRLLWWNVIWCGCSNVVARTEVVRGLGGFDEQLFQLADWDLWIRLALAGRAAAVPDVLVGYVMHEASMLLTDRRDVFPEFDYLSAKHRRAGEELGMQPDRAKFARWVARGHRRAGRRRLAAATYLRSARENRDLGAIPRALASLLPERLVDTGRRLGPSDPLRTVGAPEPSWIASFRHAR
jgi:glycosyltransferase involved in cell wall biosynthesis